MRINLIGNNWLSGDGLHVRGYGFDPEGNLLREDTLLRYFSGIASSEDFCQRLKRLNGLYAVIVESDAFQGCSIDRTRIYPLYYRCGNGEMWVSDDATSLSFKGDTLNGKAVSAYQVAGAPFEGQTLVKGIQAVKPGCLVAFEENVPHEVPYYRFEKYSEEIHSSNSKELDDVVLSVFERMVRSLDGRQVVVPLSGGYDSRLIVTMLKRLNYQHVLCYTIGRPGNGEYEVARQVARQLGYPLVFVDNTDSQVANVEMLQTEDFLRYARFLGNLVNFVWLYEYPAINYLQRNGFLEKDAVFVPGHSGDCIAGSHLRKNYIDADSSMAWLSKSIMDFSFEYGYDKRVEDSILKEFEALSEAGYLPYTIFQSFIIRNRQTHQIINSARIYEYFGYEVRLPLWDNGLVDLFLSLPYDQLRDCSLYNDYVCSLFEPYKVDIRKKDVSLPPLWKVRLKAYVKRLLPKRIIHRFIHIDDIVCEQELSATLLNELVEKGVYASFDDFTSVNEIIKDWYLMKVKEWLQSAPINS